MRKLGAQCAVLAQRKEVERHARPTLDLVDACLKRTQAFKSVELAQTGHLGHQLVLASHQLSDVGSTTRIVRPPQIVPLVVHVAAATLQADARHDEHGFDDRAVRAKASMRRAAIPVRVNACPNHHSVKRRKDAAYTQLQEPQKHHKRDHSRKQRATVDHRVQQGRHVRPRCSCVKCSAVLLGLWSRNARIHHNGADSDDTSIINGSHYCVSLLGTWICVRHSVRNFKPVQLKSL